MQVDRPSATPERCGEVESQIFDLFAHLGATEDQLDFQVLYASAREVQLTLVQLLPMIDVYADFMESSTHVRWWMPQLLHAVVVEQSAM